MPNPEISQIKLPSNEICDIADTVARQNQADTSVENALNHLGFYLDANGGLCQVNSIGD